MSPGVHTGPGPGWTSERPEVTFLSRNLSRKKGHVQKTKNVQLLAVDHSARASMKNAASCEN